MKIKFHTLALTNSKNFWKRYIHLTSSWHWNALEIMGWRWQLNTSSAKHDQHNILGAKSNLHCKKIHKDTRRHMSTRFLIIQIHHNSAKAGFNIVWNNKYKKFFLHEYNKLTQSSVQPVHKIHKLAHNAANTAHKAASKR